MRRDRRFIAKVAALVLAVAAIVVPVTIATAAPEKIFTLTMSPSSIPAGATNVTVTATFKNATPSGNSTINSLKLAATGAPGATITSATGTGTEVVAADGRSVSVTGIPPVKPGKTYVLTMKLTTPAQTSCSGTSITWSGSAWTGNSFSGDTFRFVADSSSVNTSVGASCDLRFVHGRQPADARPRRDDHQRRGRPCRSLPSRSPSSPARPPPRGSPDRSRWPSPMTPRGQEPSRAEARPPPRERRRSTNCPSMRRATTAWSPRAPASRATPPLRSRSARPR